MKVTCLKEFLVPVTPFKLLKPLIQSVANWAAYAGIALLIALVLIRFTQSLSHSALTPDLAWMLASGQWIIAHHALPTQDLFSWTLPHEPWVLYQWFFEVAVASSYKALGELNTVKLFMSIVFFVYAILPLVWGLRHRVSVPLLLLPIGLGLLSVVVNMGLRPMIVTSAGLALQWMLLQQLRQHPNRLKKALLVIIPVYILWANMHTGVVLGLLSLMLMAMGDCIERSGSLRFDPANKALGTQQGQPLPLKTYGILLITAILASLINPYGFGIYTYLYTLSNQHYLNSIIIELQSANFHLAAYRFYTVLIIIGLALQFVRSRVINVASWLHVWVFTLLTLCVQRFIVWSILFDVLIFPIALAHAVHLIKAHQPQKPPITPTFWQSYGIPGICFLMIAGTLFLLPKPTMPVTWAKCTELQAACQYYSQHALPGDKLLNDCDTGSCLLRLPHPPKVFIDSRFDFYGSNHTKAERETMFLMGDWPKHLNHWRINTVLVQKNRPLWHALQQTGEYQTIYQDAHAILLRKKSPIK